MNCLLMDIGSTFIKYGVYDNIKKTMLYCKKTPFPDGIIKAEKSFIVSREAIEEKILGIFEELKEYNLKKTYISVQMHGFILKNEDGTFSDYVSWRDKSGDINQERLKDVDFGLMGTSLKINLPAAKIKGEEKEFFTLGSYISSILTGENATHITDACASGYFYAESAKPNGLERKMVLPKVYTEVGKIGEYKGIEIFTPFGDHQISFLGSCAGEDSYLINIGTAAQISCIDTEDDYKECERRPYFDKKLRLYTVSGLNEGKGISDKENFFENLVVALKHLPKKQKIVFGGGGSVAIFPYLKERFKDLNINCDTLTEDVGMEGLKMIAESVKIKKGTMLSEIAFNNFPIIAKKSGLDFVIIDNEHGAFDWSSLQGLIMNSNLIGMDTVIRVGEPTRGVLTKFADMGVHGFLLPMTNTKEDIEWVVRCVKYSPIGKRGISTTRAHTLYFPPALDEYKKSANENMKVYAQIETKMGVDNIYDILNAEGVDGIFVGPNDLSDDLGVLAGSEEVLKCIEKVSDAANSVGKPWGIITADKKLIVHAKENGTKMISCGSELNMLVSGCKKIVEEI